MAGVEQARITGVDEVHVGVTGHRPARLVAADHATLRQRAGEALQAIAGAAGGARVEVISPLAEGADRIVARAALDAGCALRCVLPFNREDYRRDFPTAASRAEFAALLQLAGSVVELDGVHGTPEECDAGYHAAGAYTVQHADVIIAIWDGHRARGSGGTGDIVALALERHAPVVWIASTAPHPIHVITAGDGGFTTHPLAALPDLLQPPATPEPRR